MKIKCKVCGIEFKDHPSRNRKFCSKRCYGNSIIGTIFSKEHKEKIKRWHIGRTLTNVTKLKISLKKKGIKRPIGKLRNQIGEKNPCWRGGRTSLWQLIRGLEEYTNWRLEVFKRDNYTCQDCGDNKGHNLNAHHIKSFQKILNEFLQYYSQFSPLEEKSILTRLAITYEPFWNISNGITLCENCHKNARQKLLTC